MQQSLGRFRAALLIGWVLLGAIGAVYSRWKHISPWIAAPIIAAFLVEYAFYLLPGFEGLLQEVERTFAPAKIAGLMTASALLPYLIYSIPTGEFRIPALLLLLAIAAIVSFWYVVLPINPLTDIAILCIMAGVILSRILPRIYLSPVDRLPLEILGHIALIRLGIVAMLLIRHVQPVGLGFVPSVREIGIGLIYFAIFLPFGAPLAWKFGLLRPHWRPELLLQSIFVLLGIFWVVALSEEFFFRGILQNWLAAWTRSGTAAIAIASVLFGLCHLPFRAFPNWRFAALAALAGIFYGLAFRKAGSIRASMVSHAVLATTYRIFFS